MIENTECKYDIKVGCCHSSMGGMDKHQGIGYSGMKTMVVEVNNQRTNGQASGNRIQRNENHDG